MTSAKASIPGDKIVMQALAILKNTCNHCHAAPVLAFESRALTLAARRGYSRSDVSHRGTRANGDTLYAVRSDSQPGKSYLVTVHPIARPECNCLAGQRQQPCKHAGVCLGDWAERADTARRAGVPVEYWWMTRGEWLDLCEEMYEFHTARERAGR